MAALAKGRAGETEDNGDAGLVASTVASLCCQGFAVLHDLLSEAAVEGFVEQIEAELKLNRREGRTDKERTLDSISLADSSTWPKKGRRRTVECSPLGQGECWETLAKSPRLNRLLDGMFGKGTWDLKFNTDGDPVRYWYAPVVFPEAAGEALAGLDAEAESGEQGPATATQPGDLRTAELLSWREDFAKHGGGGPPPPSAWSPVNRRRVRGKGWHVDLFPWDGKRQGVVVLLVLSDWDEGGGGTCFAERSQDWVARRIAKGGREVAAAAAAEDASKEGGGGAAGDFSNDEINSLANKFLVAKARAGDMLLRSVDSRAHKCSSGELSQKLEAQGKVLVSSIVAKRGDVVLFHPWNVHSGTTNNRGEPRLMMNGMVRLKNELEGKNPLFTQTLENLEAEGMSI